jgi:lipid-binding SYLF domain-containing protein
MKAHFPLLFIVAFLIVSPPLTAQESQKKSSAQEEAPTSSLSAEEQQKLRDGVRKMRDETLERLYKANPKAREEIRKSVGYAVFDATQTNIILLVTGHGAGVAVDNGSKKETFMKMARLGTGPGIGYKQYKQILIFKDKSLFDTFGTVGADVSASGDATLKLKDAGDSLVLDGTVSFNPLLSVYQMTDRGALLQANWGGVGYVPDGELNKPVKGFGK